MGLGIHHEFHVTLFGDAERPEDAEKCNNRCTKVGRFKERFEQNRQCGQARILRKIISDKT